MILNYVDLHSEVLKNVLNIKRNLTIFSPYIKIEVVEKIISLLPKNVSINLITRAIVSDFAMGVSDLSALELLLSNDHLVFINNRIHLKTYLYDFNSLHTGSANCTNKGLGLAQNSNFETLAYFVVVENSYLRYLDTIIGTSKIANLDDINSLGLRVKNLNLEKVFVQDIALLNQNAVKDLFKGSHIFASQLPYTSSVKDLYEFIQGMEFENVDDFKHDLAVFQLDGHKFNNYSNFKTHLSASFFDHEFMSQLFSSFESSINFGGVRKFFEVRCVDNPRPSRGEINFLINNVFNWIEELAGEKCEILQPNHTKILMKKTKL